MAIYEEIAEFLTVEGRRRRFRRAMRRAELIDDIQQACLPLVRKPEDYARIAEMIRRIDEESVRSE